MEYSGHVNIILTIQIIKRCLSAYLTIVQVGYVRGSVYVGSNEGSDERDRGRRGTLLRALGLGRQAATATFKRVRSHN